MSRYWVLLALIALSSCTKNNPEEQLGFVSGYWEISQVESPYGKNMSYEVNETIDYIEIRDSTGFRKKVKPQLDGSYISTESSEKILAIIENDSLRLNYTTLYDSWRETVLEASTNVLIVKNDRGFIYTYKRYEPLNLATK